MLLPTATTAVLDTVVVRCLRRCKEYTAWRLKGYTARRLKGLALQVSTIWYHGLPKVSGFPRNFVYCRLLSSIFDFLFFWLTIASAGQQSGPSVHIIGRRICFEDQWITLNGRLIRPTHRFGTGHDEMTDVVVVGEIVLAVGALGIYTVVLPSFIPAFTMVRWNKQRSQCCCS